MIVNFEAGEKEMIDDLLTICFRSGFNVYRNSFSHACSFDNTTSVYVIDGEKYYLHRDKERERLLHYICSKGLPQPTKTIDLRKGDKL